MMAGANPIAVMVVNSGICITTSSSVIAIEVFSTMFVDLRFDFKDPSLTIEVFFQDAFDVFESFAIRLIEVGTLAPTAFV
jgi:hypothetical protein